MNVSIINEAGFTQLQWHQLWLVNVCGWKSKYCYIRADNTINHNSISAEFIHFTASLSWQTRNSKCNRITDDSEARSIDLTLVGVTSLPESMAFSIYYFAAGVISSFKASCKVMKSQIFSVSVVIYICVRSW